MTDLNEVIYGLEFTKAMITFNPSTGEDIEPGNLNEANKTTYDACVDAIALLKEQEAKQTSKDIKSYYGLAGGPHGVCPSCCTTIPRIIGQETRFCPFCGQAVKWE